MTTRKIEIVEERCILNGQEYLSGDVKSFPSDQADEYIRRGWAKCCETGEIGDRVPGAASLNVASVTQKAS